MADTPSPTRIANATLNQLRDDALARDKVVKTIQENAAKEAFWTHKEAAALSFSILIFGLLVLLLMSTLVAAFKVNINRILRAFALVLIIVAAVFLIVAGYDEKQIAPVMGLLGTIAGYLLGSRHSSGEIGESDKGEVQPGPGEPGPKSSSKPDSEQKAQSAQKSEPEQTSGPEQKPNSEPERKQDSEREQ